MKKIFYRIKMYFIGRKVWKAKMSEPLHIHTIR